MGCPLKHDKGYADFMEHPKLLRAWVRAGLKWWNRDREKPLASKEKFGSVYGLLWHDIFCRRYNQFAPLLQEDLWGEKVDFKRELEKTFGVELP